MKLKKLMDAYCARVGKEAWSIRFLFDGDLIAPDSTPKDLGMEDEDEIFIDLGMEPTFSWGLV